jgi:hypothetical protein
LTSMGGSEKVWRLTKQKIVIQVNPNKLVNYIIMQPWVVVSCDILVGGMVLYPLGVTIVFGMKLHTITLFDKQKLITRFHY